MLQYKVAVIKLLIIQFPPFSCYLLPLTSKHFSTLFSDSLYVLPLMSETKFLMMEAASSSETSVNFYQTTERNIPEDSLHTRRRENLKSHLVFRCLSCETVSL
jgi:hypothetical protein